MLATSATTAFESLRYVHGTDTALNKPKYSVDAGCFVLLQQFS